MSAVVRRIRSLDLCIINRMPPKSKYTCNDYREEMRLLGLKNRLNEKNLSETEKQAIEAEITKLEKALEWIRTQAGIEY